MGRTRWAAMLLMLAMASCEEAVIAAADEGTKPDAVLADQAKGETTPATATMEDTGEGLFVSDATLRGPTFTISDETQKALAPGVVMRVTDDNDLVIVPPGEMADAAELAQCRAILRQIGQADTTRAGQLFAIAGPEGAKGQP